MAHTPHENKLCEWFGHNAESMGPDRTSDFPSETFYCPRCRSTYSVNAWGGPPPAPKIHKVVLYTMAAGVSFAAMYFLR